MDITVNYTLNACDIQLNILSHVFHWCVPYVYKIYFKIEIKKIWFVNNMGSQTVRTH